MKTLLTKIMVVLFLSIFFYACTEDYFEFDKITTEDWRPELAFPLVNSNLTLEDIVLSEDTVGLIQEDPNSKILQVIYDGQVFSTKGSSVINLPNLNFTETLDTIFPPASGQTITISRNEEIDFNTTFEVDSLLLNNGNFALTLENEYRHNVVVDMRFPGIRAANGQVFTQSFNLPARSGSSPVVRSAVTNLQDYTIDMTYGSQNHSTIPVEITMTMNTIPGNGGNIGEELSIQGDLRNLDFKNFTGYIGQEILDLEIDTVYISLFRNFISGRIYLSNPFLDITIFNGYGTPINLEFQTLKSRNENHKDPNQREIDINLPNNPQVLNYSNGFGIDSTPIIIDRNNPMNSNIGDVISSLPREIVYDAKAVFNQGNNGAIRNYISDTSTIGLDVFLRIPFEGFVQDFTLVDTIDLSFDGVDELEKGLLRVKATNSFPIDAKIQVIFTDENYSAIDSLFGNGPEALFAAGTNNQPTTGTKDFVIDRERLEAIAAGDKVLLRAILDTRNAHATLPDTVSFTNSNRLDVSIGLKGTILID